MFDLDKISFRKLTLADLPLMQKWLNHPYVHEWYDKDKQNTLGEITNRYGPKIKGEKPTDCYFVLYENQPVAYIQSYKVNDWPVLGNYVGCDDKTGCVDLFIGETEFTGKGFGSVMLSKFLKNILFADAGLTTCIIGPEPNNIRAIKSYQKVGFEYLKTIQIPNEPNLTYLMEVGRNSFHLSQ